MSAILISDNFHVLSPELVSSAAPAQLDLRTAVVVPTTCYKNSVSEKFQDGQQLPATRWSSTSWDTYVQVHIVPLLCFDFLTPL